MTIEAARLLALAYVLVCPAVVVQAPDDRVSTVYQRQCDVVQVVPDSRRIVKRKKKGKTNG